MCELEEAYWDPALGYMKKMYEIIHMSIGKREGEKYYNYIDKQRRTIHRHGEFEFSRGPGDDIQFSSRRDLALDRK